MAINAIQTLSKYSIPLYDLATQTGSILGSELTFDGSTHIAQTLNQRGEPVVARGVKTSIVGVLEVCFIDDFKTDLTPVWRVVNLTDTTAQAYPCGFFNFIRSTNSTAGFFVATVYPALPALEIML